MIAFVIPFAGESSEAQREMNSNDAGLDTALQKIRLQKMRWAEVVLVT